MKACDIVDQYGDILNRYDVVNTMFKGRIELRYYLNAAKTDQIFTIYNLGVNNKTYDLYNHVTKNYDLVKVDLDKIMERVEEYEKVLPNIRKW